MKNNELDIVDELLANEKPAKIPIGTKSAKNEKKPKQDWGGDCLNISEKEKLPVGLPLESYLIIKEIGTPNSSACVYDPVHWIYGWGADTMSAVRDCLNNIRDWRKQNPDLIQDYVEGWQERLEKYGHPFKADDKGVDVPKSVKKFVEKESPLVVESTEIVAPIEDTPPSTADILSDLGL
jgi:hypothetical protein